LLALALGRHDDAVTYLEEAVAINQRAGALPWLTRARFNLAEALAARGAEGDDAERAGRLLAEATRGAEQIQLADFGPRLSDRPPSPAG
jgi:hypothetical protein